MNRDRIFKFGMSIAVSAEICMLFGIMFVALREYEPTHVESFGLGAAILSAALASSVFLTLLYLILKWKRQ